MNSGVYIITNLINDKIYVGRAVNVLFRLRVHKSKLIGQTHQNEHLQNAVNKYGISNFKFDVLEFCETSELPKIEHYWCIKLNAHDRQFGYNIQPTDPNDDYIVSEETRKKIGDKHRGKIMSEKSRQLMSKSKRENPRIIPEKERQATRERLIGRKQTDNNKKASSLKNSKPVLQLDEKMNIIKEWKSVTEAKNSLKIFDIGKCANGKRKKAGGFYWIFKQKYNV